MWPERHCGLFAQANLFHLNSAGFLYIYTPTLFLSISPLFSQFHNLTVNCWYPPLKEIGLSEENERIRQKMTSATDRNLHKSQGTLTIWVSFQKTQKPTGSWAVNSGKTVKYFVTALATTDDCVLNMCVSVYTSFPLESVTLAGGRGVGSGWVAVNPLRSPGLLCLCSLSDSQGFSPLAVGDGLTVLDWQRSAGEAISCLSFLSSENMKASLAPWAQLSSAAEPIVVVHLCVYVCIQYVHTLYVIKKWPILHNSLVHHHFDRTWRVQSVVVMILIRHHGAVEFYLTLNRFIYLYLYST